MRKIWLDSYPAGVRPEIDPNEFASINELLAYSCRRFAGKPAFRSLGETIDFTRLELLTRRFAAGLLELTPLRKGSRVALMLPNLLQYPVALFGALRAGMTVVNVNPLYTPRELEHQLADSGAEAIVILENFAHTLESVLPRGLAVKHVITTQAGDLLPAPKRWIVNTTVKRVKRAVPPWRIAGAIGLRKLLRRGRDARFDEATPAGDDIAFLQYTGGTTGGSKGAILTHGNIVANVLQAAEWASAGLDEGSEVVVVPLPLYHVFSLTVGALLFTKMGGLQVLIANPRDFPAFVRELKGLPFSAMLGVNTLFNGLLNTRGFDGLDFSHLKFVIGGGAAVHPSVAARWEVVTGRPLVEGYGLTEASPLVACNPLDLKHSGGIGLPVPSTDISIRDDAEHEVQLGSEGEICVSGPQVMQGYWNQPEETRKAFTADGWLRTGDIGTMMRQVSCR